MTRTEKFFAVIFFWAAVAGLAAFNGADAGEVIVLLAIFSFAAPVAALVGYLLFRTVRAYLHILNRLERN